MRKKQLKFDDVIVMPPNSEMLMYSDIEKKIALIIRGRKKK